MSDTGTYKDTKGLLKATEEELKEIYKRNQDVKNGLKVSCGHDFWDKKIEPGEVVLCKRCNMFFAKIRILPWVTVHELAYEKGKFVYGTNHLDYECYVPVPVRLTSGY